MNSYHTDRPSEPACQRQAIHRRTIMRKARSKTKRPKLLAELLAIIAVSRLGDHSAGRSFGRFSLVHTNIIHLGSLAMKGSVRGRR